MTIGIMARLLAGETLRATADRRAIQVVEHVIKLRMPVVVKAADELRIAYGWASVTEIDGKPVVDSDNEIITEADLDAFARKFVLGQHGGKVMHEGERESDLVESMMFTREKQAALGIDLKKSGWWVGLQYRKAETWARIKSGELPMFSLMGYARARPATPTEMGA